MPAAFEEKESRWPNNFLFNRILINQVVVLPLAAILLPIVGTSTSSA